MAPQGYLDLRLSGSALADGLPSRAPDRPSWGSRTCRGSGAESSALLVQRSRQAVSAALRCSLPHRGSQTVAHDLASLSLACLFRARAGSRRRSRGSAAPSRASVPFSACGVADSVTTGMPHPPPSVLSVSRALDGLHPATPVRACFIPVTLVGFHLQGFDPLREAAPLSRPVLSCRSRPSSEPLNPDGRRGASEFCSPRRIRTARDRNPPAADALLVFCPLRFSPPPSWDRLPEPSSHALRR
jgi:hypothetical protein